jgi:hypothetical protein
MYGLLGGQHTIGHFDEARNKNVPTELIGLMENYNFNNATNSDRANVNGAGFRYQDEFNKRINTNESSLANAIYKLSYLAGLPQMIDKDITRGDINDIKNDVGGFPKEILAATMLSDLIRSTGRFPNTSLTFDQNRNGTPMLMFNHRF